MLRLTVHTYVYICVYEYEFGDGFKLANSQKHSEIQESQLRFSLTGCHVTNWPCCREL